MLLSAHFSHWLNMKASGSFPDTVFQLAFFLAGSQGKSCCSQFPIHRPGEWQPVPLWLCGCVQWPQQWPAHWALLRHVPACSPCVQWQQDDGADDFRRQHSWERLHGHVLGRRTEWKRYCFRIMAIIAVRVAHGYWRPTGCQALFWALAMYFSFNLKFKRSLSQQRDTKAPRDH